MHKVLLYLNCRGKLMLAEKRVKEIEHPRLEHWSVEAVGSQHL